MQRPAAGAPWKSWLLRSAGMNDFTPAIVVLFEPARSAEPPHSSGTALASAESTLPEAARVASEPGSKTGSAASRSAGASRAITRSSSSARSGLAARHASKRGSHSARSSLARTAALARVASTTEVSTANGVSSKPSSSFSAVISAAPSFEPWTLWSPCLFGSGQPMMVVTLMKCGLSVTALARSSTSYSSATFSS